MKRILLFLVVISLLSSCTQDAYEKGEGKYSLMRGDFAEAMVNGAKQATKIITDDGDELQLTTPYTAKWMTKADTIYRCMLYYNKVEGQAEVISMGQVPCATIVPIAEMNKPLATDPVKFESTWMSRSGRYLNISIQLKTGATDDTTAVQSLAIISDTVVTHPDSKRTRHLILHHEQGNVPQYYSTQVYISIPTERIDADSAQVSINSYDGVVTARHRCR